MKLIVTMGMYTLVFEPYVDYNVLLSAFETATLCIDKWEGGKPTLHAAPMPMEFKLVPDDSLSIGDAE